jgi:NitT/TauT family transport system substrate-binding protein
MSALRAGRPVWAGLALAALLVTGARAETAIRFTLDRAIEAPAAPFLLPLDRGYYKAEGLNVAVDPATGPLEPIARVAAGSYEMGVADINALIKYRDAHPKAPIKAVFMVTDRPAYAVIARKSRGVTVPKDLEGKKLGAPPDDLSFAVWPIFAKAAGIDTAKVGIENISPPLREPMLAAGQVDAITGLAFTSFINLDDKGVPVDDIVVMLMADYGVELYGNAVIVNTQFASEHPDAVRGFLRALVKGLKQTVAQPAAAVAVVLKHNDALKKELELKRLAMVIHDDIMTTAVKANGFGGIDRARFARAIDQLALAYKFKAAKPKPDDIFDDSYLPPAADRKVRAR